MAPGLDPKEQRTTIPSTDINMTVIGCANYDEAEEAAKACFCACSCRGVARFDMMLSADGTPFVIDINTVPGMTETSLVPDAGRAAGIEFPELCQKILYMAGFED